MKLRAGLLGLALVLFTAFPVVALEEVHIAPKWVTWDGLTVVVTQGQADLIEYRFPESQDWWMVPPGCTFPMVAGDECQIGTADNFAGQIIEVRATYQEGSQVIYGSFAITLAVHVEPGYYFQNMFAGISQGLSNIRISLESLMMVNSNMAGYQQLNAAVVNLQNAGMFGQAKQVGSAVTDALKQITEGPRPPETPTLGGTDLDLRTAATTPCNTAEYAELHFCIPMKAATQTWYFHIDIPAVIRQNPSGWGELWKAIRIMVYVGLSIWIINQFVPQQTT